MALCGMLIGLLVPMASLLYISYMAGAGGLWTVLIWPSSFLMMGPEVGPDAPGFSTLCISIAINMFLYALFFAFSWSLAWVFQRWRESLRDGTTI